MKAKLKVTLLAATPDAEKLVASAAKLCYSPSGIDDLREGLTEEKTEAFLQNLMSMGHESPLEHVSFTFGIEGVSRSLLAQITRHRLASYSVKSQRYVTEGQFTFVLPPEIEADESAKALFMESMASAQKYYDDLTEILKSKHRDLFLSQGMDAKRAESMAEKKAIEDARFVLPNACETKMIVTMNVRSLYNFFHHRLCERAQWEIRTLALEMLKLVKKEAPVLFQNAGPSCVAGACPEGKMSCGKAAEKRSFFTRL